MNRSEPYPRKGKPDTRRRTGGLMMMAAAVVSVTFAGVDADVAVDSPTPVSAVSAEEIQALPTRPMDDFLDSLVRDSKVSLNVRVRAEVADQDGLETSQAYTVRTRLGYTTNTANPLYFHVELEDIHAADESQYNAAGFSGQPEKTVIADPEDTELNQAFVHYNFQPAASSVRFGRQRIQLDDDRFIGNVGWRQNEQTFDAVMFVTHPLERLELNYAYLWEVNRIFGPDAGVDFDADSHLIRLSYDDPTLGKLTGFAYLLDLDGTPAAAPNSSDTYGLRYEATRKLKGEDDGPKLNYVLSYASQTDTGDNPKDYEAHYYLIDVKYLDKGWHVGAGWEVLGSDDGVAGFRTPLATGHKFNGWADVFLTTPDDGLEDTYVYLGGDLPDEWTGKLIYHWFDADEGSASFGNEFDAVLSKKLNPNTELLAKYAYFDGDGPFNDLFRFWLQLTLNY